MFFDIPFTNGKYSITKAGQVRRNATNHIIKPFITNKGYMCIDLRINNQTVRYLVHRLVAITFLPNPNGYNIVNHKDCNPLNNNVENLEWCTYSYNNKYAYIVGNKPLTPKQLEARRKPSYHLRKIVCQYDLNGRLLQEFPCITAAADHINGKVVSISSCAHGRLQTYKGYVWKFKEV